MDLKENKMPDMGYGLRISCAYPPHLKRALQGRGMLGALHTEQTSSGYPLEFYLSDCTYKDHDSFKQTEAIVSEILISIRSKYTGKDERL
jgi:hypothetical protein